MSNIHYLLKNPKYEVNFQKYQKLSKKNIIALNQDKLYVNPTTVNNLELNHQIQINKFSRYYLNFLTTLNITTLSIATSTIYQKQENFSFQNIDSTDIFLTSVPLLLTMATIGLSKYLKNKTKKLENKKENLEEKLTLQTSDIPKLNQL